MLPYQDPTLPLESRVSDLLARLTLEEKVALCHGRSDMEAGGLERHGIPRLKVADGPQGIRLVNQRTEQGEQATALPCGIALAATFDPEMAEAYGGAIALDAAAVGVHASLGPGMNLMRTPLNGRTFEYYGEDPVLAGKIAAGYVRGCQAHRVAATPKHLAVNNQEICRTTGSSDLDERTLRELYLTGFEIVAKEARPWMFMSSYNRINGQYAAECGLVQDLIAKREWGFDGVMVSDWGGAHDTVGCALGGLDLEMGSPADRPHFGKALVDAVNAGIVPESCVDDKARRVLRLLFRTGVVDREAPGGVLGGKPQRRTAEATAAAAAVLLKNADHFLPLHPEKTKTLLVVGPNAEMRHHTGPLALIGGSGAVHCDREITPLAGLTAYAASRGIEVDYHPALRFEHDTICPAGLFGESGLKSVYFHDEKELLAKKHPLFQTITQDGVWIWGGPGSQVAGGGSGAPLPPNGFAVRIQARLAPSGDEPAELLANARGGRLKVRINGKERLDAPEADKISGAVPFAKGEAAGAEMEIDFFTRDPASARLELGWRRKGVTGKEAMLAAARRADAVVFVGGTHHLYDKEALGWGNVPHADIPDLKLPEDQDALILELAAANPKTAVVLINGSVVDVEPWIERIPALLEMWYPGESGGKVLAEILFGERAPGGRLPFTWGKRLLDYACHANGSYPGNREDADPRTVYQEGLFIGYRHFDRAGIEPRFPFGHGMSYTDFAVEWSGVDVLDASVRSPRLNAKATIRNQGSREGAEVVHLYVGAVDPKVERPIKELKRFQKIFLAPGESRDVEFSLGWRDFACWDAASKRWTVPSGTYRIFCGRSTRAIDVEAEVVLQ